MNIKAPKVALDLNFAIVHFKDTVYTNMDISTCGGQVYWLELEQ